jgi:hypothetical protein
VRGRICGTRVLARFAPPAALVALFLWHPAVAGATVSAWFGDQSYAPGQTAYLHVDTTASLTVQLFRVGPGSGELALAPVDDPRVMRGPTVGIRLWDWPSGVYFARIGDA